MMSSSRVQLGLVPAFSHRLLGLLALAVGAAAFAPESAKAQRPLGTDASSYQSLNLDWTYLKNNGITFAWAKATEGLTVNDANFTTYEANAKAAGVLIGPYHFAHPELHAPDVEAAHFWSIAQNYIKGGGSYIMPMLDMEGFTGVTGATSYSDWASQWWSIIVSNAAAAGVTIKPVVYV